MHVKNNVNTQNSNVTSIMSINSLKSILVIKGNVGCRICWTLVNSLSSASSTSSSTVLWCCSQRPEGYHGEWQLVVVFGRRPSRNPTMSLRHKRASRRWLTWRWCGLKQLSCCASWVFAGHGHFVNMKRWHYWHVHAQTRVLVTVMPRIFMTSTRLILVRRGGCWKRNLALRLPLQP